MRNIVTLCNVNAGTIIYNYQDILLCEKWCAAKLFPLENFNVSVIFSLLAMSRVEGAHKHKGLRVLRPKNF